MYFHIVTAAFYLPRQKMVTFEGCEFIFRTCNFTKNELFCRYFSRVLFKSFRGFLLQNAFLYICSNSKQVVHSLFKIIQNYVDNKHSSQRGPNPLFYEDLPILPTPTFFKFYPTSLLPPTPTLHCSFCCLVSLTELVIAPHLMCYFTQCYSGSTHAQPCQYQKDLDVCFMQ